jgi:hypothetical protein
VSPSSKPSCARLHPAYRNESNRDPNLQFRQRPFIRQAASQQWAILVVLSSIFGLGLELIRLPAALLLVPPVIDSAVDFRIDSSAMTEMHRDRETDCREEVCGEAQR